MVFMLLDCLFHNPWFHFVHTSFMAVSSPSFNCSFNFRAFYFSHICPDFFLNAWAKSLTRIQYHSRWGRLLCMSFACMLHQLFLQFTVLGFLILCFYTYNFRPKLFVGSTWTKIGGLSSSCMPHTFSVDSECVMFSKTIHCAWFSHFMLLHIKCSTEVIFGLISSQKCSSTFLCS